MRRGENRSTRRKTSWCRVGNQLSQSIYDDQSGNRTCAHWWEASALTTAPSLHVTLILLPPGWDACPSQGAQTTSTVKRLNLFIHGVCVACPFFLIYSKAARELYGIPACANVIFPFVNKRCRLPFITVDCTLHFKENEKKKKKKLKKRLTKNKKKEG